MPGCVVAARHLEVHEHVTLIAKHFISDKMVPDYCFPTLPFRATLMAPPFLSLYHPGQPPCGADPSSTLLGSLGLEEGSVGT